MYANKQYLQKFNIEPIFISSANEQIEIEHFKHLKVNVEEKYNNLYKKIYLAFKEVYNNFNFDYICKIDDDTVFNIKNYNSTLIDTYDYIGRIIKSYSSQITLSYNLFMMNRKINLIPSLFDKEFKFASGDCYFLSKKAIRILLEQENVINALNFELICEDQLFGYLLNNKDILINNIIESNSFIENNLLQVTKDWMSCHPVNETVFNFFINKSSIEQIELFKKYQTINLNSRIAYFSKLENEIKKTVVDFFNSKKNIGLG